jgi:hypothetical protein
MQPLSVFNAGLHRLPKPDFVLACFVHPVLQINIQQSGSLLQSHVLIALAA